MNASNAADLTVHVIPPHPLAPDDRWMASFPLRAFMEYGAYRSAPGSARGLVRNSLQEWRLGAFEEKASLVVTELMTNSIIATEKVAWEAGRPPVRLWLLAGPDGVLVAVWDAVTTPPRQRVAGELEENGRGLGIVGAYCARWDCYRLPAPYGGKVTRALISDPHTEGSETALGGERTMASARCACGFREAGDETIDDHLAGVFTPDDGKGPDGTLHLEWETALWCQCGAGGRATELDAHFLAVFTPADHVGRDGAKHEREICLGFPVR